MKFLDDGGDVDQKLVTWVVESMQIHRARNLQDFSWFDQGYFTYLEAYVRHEMELLEIPCYFEH